MTAQEFKKKHNFAWCIPRGRNYCCWCKNHVITTKVNRWYDRWEVNDDHMTETFEPVLICKACGRGFTTNTTSGCDAWEG